MTARLSALAPTALYPAEIFLVLISVRGLVNPRAIVRLEKLDQLKEKFSELIGNGIHDLLARSISASTS
jgi:hypothetical protein